MSRNSFWGGVAAGAAGTVATLWACGLLKPLAGMERVERSIQIGRSAEEVFTAFAHVESIPRFVRSIVSVASCEDVSAWTAQIEGRRFEWDLEIVQVIPEQVIGWKCYRGPKHSGQISLFSLGQNTLVHVEVNYLARIRFGRLLGDSSTWDLGDLIDEALRDLKATLELDSRRTASSPAIGALASIEQATGTFGSRSVLHSSNPDPVQREEESSHPPES